MPTSNDILNEFYDAKESEELLIAFIDKHKDNPEAEPIVKTAQQAIQNISNTPTPNIQKNKIVETQPIGSNPLMQYFRNKGIYVVLPSKGKFYNEKPNLSELGEVLINPMTAKDELVFKSPDYLLNGEALKRVIKSCVPDIKNVDEISTQDFNVIMLGIRSATYGNEMPYEINCNKCNQKIEFSVDIDRMFDGITELEDEYIVDINPLTVYIKPFDLKAQIKSSLAQFEQEAITNNLSIDTTLTDVQKNEELSNIINKIAGLSYEMVLGSIIKVKMPDGVTIDDIEQIKEWMYHLDKKNYDLLNEEIGKISNLGFTNTVPVNCETCKKDITVPILFDPTLFFA
tara:strand:- start:305 stop:1333 length:1029 start_codon:yes stop_codon:yes gene_type:complete